MCTFEEKRDHKNWDYQLSKEELEEVKKDYKKFVKWEANNSVSLEAIEQGRYKRKFVYFLQPVTKGETYYDRLGAVSY